MKRANKATDGAGGAAAKMRARTQAEAGKTRAALAKMTEPARLLSPELEKAYGTLERIGKASASVRAAFAHRGSQPAARRRSGGASGRSGTDDGPQGAPLKPIGTAAADVSKIATRLGGAAAEVGEVGATAEAAAGGLAGLVTGAAALAIALPAAAIAAEVAAAKFAAGPAREGQAIKRTAETTGLDPALLQRYQGAAEREGLGADAATAALARVRLALHNLSYRMAGPGGAEEANYLRMAGVRIPQQGEAPDMEAAMQQIADATARQKDPNTRGKLTAALGVDGIQSLLAKGSAGVREELAAVDKTGVVASGSDLAKADEGARRQTAFDQAAKGARRRAGLGAVDLAAPGLEAGAGALAGFDPRNTGDLVHKAGDVLAHAGEAIQHAGAGAAASLASVARTAASAAANLSRIGAREAAAVVGAAATTFGVSPAAAQAIAYRESGFNPAAHAKTSTAAGLFQFTQGTWLATLKAHAAQVGHADIADQIQKDAKGRFHVQGGAAAAARIQQMRFDPTLNAQMGASLMADNKSYLQPRLHRDVSGGELYMAHFLGASGALKFLQARDENPNADAAKLFPKEAAANHGVFYKPHHGGDRTLEEVYAFLTAKRGGFSLDPAKPEKNELAITITDGRPVKAVAKAGARTEMTVTQTRTSR